MIKLFCRAYRNRRGFFVVERAAGHKLFTFASEWDAPIYDVDNVNARHQVIDKTTWNLASHGGIVLDRRPLSGGEYNMFR
jgi:hypothetical protein